MFNEMRTKKQWIQYENETFELVAKSENIRLKQREPGRDWFVVERDSSWRPGRLAPEAWHGRHNREPWFSNSTAGNQGREEKRSPDQHARTLELRHGTMRTEEKTKEKDRATWIIPTKKRTLARDSSASPQSTTQAGPAVIGRPLAANQPVGNGTPGRAVLEGMHHALKAEQGMFPPTDPGWGEHLSENIRNAAKQGRKDWISYGQYNPKKNLEKARTVVMLSTLSPPVAIAAGAASGLTTFGASKLGGTLLSAGASWALQNPGTVARGMEIVEDVASGLSPKTPVGYSKEILENLSGKIRRE
ncbi:MAG: hypothetical protein V3573_00555 [Desulfovibrionaceae bacterium]